jgi:hypothetical protein
MLIYALESRRSLGAADRGEDIVGGAGTGGTASVPSDSFSFFFVWQREKWDGTEPV